ncbi:MAG: hypothetical protein J6B79_00800 [Clostridia bacterium]|nr:hypothetical protein [Clostridia bacterium]
MKTNEQFTQVVLQKAQRVRKRNFWIKCAVGAVSVCLLLFLVGFSNIITFTPMQSQAYKNYMQSYVSNDGSMRLKILTSGRTVVTNGDDLYVCSTRERGEGEFSLDVFERNGQRSTGESLEVDFSQTGAYVRGYLNGELVSESLNIVTDMQVEEGYWYGFYCKETGADGYEQDSSMHWYIIDDEQSYLGESTWLFECEFVSVGDKILQVTSDQASGLGNVALVEYDTTTYDYPVLKTTVPRSDTQALITYFRKATEDELYEYSEGEFNAGYISFEIDTFVLDGRELYNMQNVDWQIRPYPRTGKTLLSLPFSLSLNADKTVNFVSSGHFLINIKCGGTWCAVRDGIVVFLDKEIPNIGIKAFVIMRGDSRLSDSFDDIAVSEIKVFDAYKVGYHDFTYYGSEIDIKVFWGEKWNALLTAKAEVVYDKFYTLNNEQVDGFTVTQKTEVVFRRNGVCEVYYDGQYRYRAGYELNRSSVYEFPYLKFVTPDYTDYLSSVYIFCDGRTLKFSRFSIFENRLFVDDRCEFVLTDRVAPVLE